MATSTILIIDDDPAQKQKLEQILDVLPCTIITTDTASKALDILRYTEVAIVLMDFSLKGLNLQEFMHNLRKDHYGEDTHVILIMDKNHNRSEETEAYRSGAVDYIEKPFNADTVRHMVRVFVKLFHKKKKVRELLLNILPREIAMELEAKGKVKPKRYGSATVLFGDFVSFSHRTREMSPVELVNHLDGFFAEFDKITTKYHVEKIKTIGDAYMGVGGIPEKRKENPILSVLAAVEIANFMEKHSQNNHSSRKSWELRIGLHAGPLVAGVIGKKKFAYDVWGDTVNIASRICSACEPNKVNISTAVYEKIKDYFDCHYRGEIEGKNIGHVGMYFVNGLKPQYSIGGRGRLPNKERKQIAGLIFVKYERLKDHILDRLKNELPENLYYHGVHHTLDVLNAIERIGKSEGVSQEEQLMLNTAALFHDAGYLYTYDHNEELAIKMAKKILPDYGYTPNQIKIISGIIRTTKVRSLPKTRLQEIMNDADYDYLGGKDYETIVETLYKEMCEQKQKISRKEWVLLQIRFLEKHKYFTESAGKTREKSKLQQIERLKKIYAKYNKEK